MFRVTSEKFNSLEPWEKESLEGTFDRVSSTLAKNEDFCSKVNKLFKQILASEASDDKIEVKIKMFLIWSLDIEGNILDFSDQIKRDITWERTTIAAIDAIAQSNLLAATEPGQMGHRLYEVVSHSKEKAIWQTVPVWPGALASLLKFEDSL